MRAIANASYRKCEHFLKMRAIVNVSQTQKKQITMEQNKNYKPFDLEKAKSGAKVVTRDGHEARIICWDRGHKTDHIVALVEYTEDGETVEDVITYTNQGTFYDDGKEFSYDLFMAPTIVEKWVNVYKSRTGGYYNGSHHDSEQEALVNKADNEYVTTIKISWEE